MNRKKNFNIGNGSKIAVIGGGPAGSFFAYFALGFAEQKEIREYLIVALASRSAGNEIADQLELIVECLEYRAADVAAPGNNPALTIAQAAIAPLSAATREILVVSMANRAAAGRVADEIDAAGVSAQAQSDAV